MLKELLKLERGHRQLFFLLSMILLVIIFPFILGNQVSNLIYASALSLVLLAGIHVISEDKHFRRLGIILGSIAIGAGFLPYLVDADFLKFFILAKVFLYWLFFSFTAFVIIREVILGKKINSEMIYGSIAGYILLGLSGAMVFLFLEIINPASFSINISGINDTHTFIYFSFVTLATLGYGDIIPTAPLAQMLAVMHSISGQIYLTILVAMLVGKYIAKSLK